MTDFTDAFQEGQGAAARAARAREEINEVFRTLSENVSKATKGRLVVGVSEFTSPLSNFMALAASLEDPAAPKRGVEQWIWARNAMIKDSVRRLARWQQAHGGYPCTITFGGRDLRSHNRVALETTLSEFLKDAWVGEQLHDLLELPADGVTDEPDSGRS